MDEEPTIWMIISGIVFVIAIVLSVHYFKQNQLCSRSGGTYVRTMYSMKCIY